METICFNLLPNKHTQPLPNAHPPRMLASMFMRLFFRLLAIGSVCSPSLAQTQLLVEATPSSKPNTQNLLADAARSVGATQCLPAIERLSALAISGSRTHEVLVDWDRKKPNTAPLFSLIGVVFPGSIAAASITAVPQAGGECAIAAERISVAPYTCKSIAEVELNGYRASPLLPMFTVYTSPSDPGASVSLIDSPPSCLIIRRHIQYGWQEQAAPATRVP